MKPSGIVPTTKMTNLQRYLIRVIGLLISFQGCVNATNQSALMNKLFNNYNPDTLPYCDSLSKPVDVYVGIAIRQVIELNEPKQILTINAWIRLKWNDCQLVWNSSEYGGITSLVIPFERIWTPDITLFDNAADELAGLKDYRPAVYSDGTVIYFFPTVIASLCNVDVTYFPYDTQYCPLSFGSWAYHGNDLNIENRSETGDISSFKVNTEWKLSSVPLERTVTYYSCCTEPYPAVTFYVTLKRKPLFYVLNLLFPCILITSVAMLGFLLPPDAGEKVSLEITVLLSLAVFLLVVSETLPPTSENFPYIGIYFACAMVMVTVSTVLTVIVLNFHYKGQHGKPVPACLRKVFLGGLAMVLRVKDYDATVHPSNNTEMTIEEVETIKQKSQMNGNGLHHNNHLGFTRVNETNPTVPSNLEPLASVLKDQLKILKKVEHGFSEHDKRLNLNSEWQRVAMVMDRLFLLLFLSFMVICTCAILLQCIVQY